MTLVLAGGAHADKLTLPDRTTRSVLEGIPVSAHGTVAADLTLESDAALGYYSIGFKRRGILRRAMGSFYVEEYKKPEYQVTVKPGVPRVLQGNRFRRRLRRATSLASRWPTPR
jgi:hypothetical protein